MKHIFLLFTFLTTLSVQAGLESKVPATAEGFTIPNTHVLDDYGVILRGMAPRHQVNELAENGVTDVLIFKNQTRSEVDDEIKSLNELGYGENDIHHIPFKWKDLNLEQACEQTIEALKLMKEVYESEGRKLFFHCTVGEDRTGHLSGIWDMLLYEKDKKEVFKSQMCERGFSAGNKGKPYKVVKAIREGLSPLFFKMARLIERGHLSYDDLDINSCKKMEWVSEIPRCD